MDHAHDGLLLREIWQENDWLRYMGLLEADTQREAAFLTCLNHASTRKKSVHISEVGLKNVWVMIIQPRTSSAISCDNQSLRTWRYSLL